MCPVRGLFLIRTNKRCQSGLVGLDQHLNEPLNDFRWCSLFQSRLMGYNSVVVSINTVARKFHGCVNIYYNALAVD